LIGNGKEPPMKCPKCNLVMKPYVFENIEVDRCDLCNGVWLDKGEMEAILEKKLGTQVDISEFNRDSEIYNEIPAHCTKCDKEMEEKKATGDIVINWCSGCESVFFDPGELRKLQDMTAK
jgi:Zn-finger nucleic acid-binding protein